GGGAVDRDPCARGPDSPVRIPVRRGARMVPPAADRAGSRRPRRALRARHLEDRRSRHRGGDPRQGHGGALARRRAQGRRTHRHRAQGQGAGLRGGRSGGDPPVGRRGGEAGAAAGRRRRLGAGQSGLWSAAGGRRHRGRPEGRRRGRRCGAPDPARLEGAVAMSSPASDPVTDERALFDIRPVTDRAFLDELLRLRWSGGALVLRGRIVRPNDVEALAAYHDGKLAGVATWLIEGPVIYLATLNNISGERGVGVALLEAMKEFGRQKHAALLRVIVTNDNLNALGFYQRRGFRIIAVSPGAIDMIRTLMPNIPDIGANRIPI